MIIRVYGRANGTEITFTHAGGDIWTAQVPSNLAGEFVVDLWAENDAGQTAYVCKVLFAIHGHELQVSILDRGFSGKLSLCGLIAELEKKCLSAELKKGGFTVEHKVC